MRNLRAAEAAALRASVTNVYKSKHISFEQGYNY
jgi:hypothetical protein